MISSDDQIFIAQAQSSEHFRVIQRLIADYRLQVSRQAENAKSSDELLIIQGRMQGLSAISNLLSAAQQNGQEILAKLENPKT